MEMAVREGLTVYDCAYLILARDLNCDLISNDKKLKELAMAEAGGKGK